jgi:AraC-like DNA-binding protein
MSTTAAQKKQTHIVEYVLYVWQMEDLLRAAGFSESVLVALFQDQEGEDLKWLVDLGRQMQAEQKSESGHVSDIVEVQTELALLHDLLMGPMEDEVYVSAFETAEPVLREFEVQKMSEGMRHPTEVMLTALYGLLVLKMKKEAISLETQAAMQPIREMANALARGHVRVYQGR